MFVQKKCSLTVIVKPDFVGILERFFLLTNFKIFFSFLKWVETAEKRTCKTFQGEEVEVFHRMTNLP